MLDTYEEESGFRPNNESDIMIRLRVLAGEVYRERVYAEYIMRQMFPTTAEGEYLDAHAQQRGLSRKNGTIATGKVTFIAASADHGDILIPAGTSLCTNDEQLRYETDSDAVLGANFQSIIVDAHAAQEGSAYNIAMNKIGIMITPIPGIGVVKNNVKFTGGSDKESDEQLRERIADSYREISNGANAAYYRSVAMSVDGVYSASAIGCARGTGTVDVYACAKGATLSAEKIAEIQALLDEKREINVDHQLIRERHKDHRNYFVEKTKTACGCRVIPMTDEVYESLKRIVKKRKKPKTETIVDGYSGFILLDKTDHPKVALHIENECRWAMHKYNKKFPNDPLPHITPHVYRHTFCTKMAQMGMELKALQYLMGHSDASVTMNVYTHTNYQYAAEQLKLVTQKKDEHAAM